MFPAQIQRWEQQVTKKEEPAAAAGIEETPPDELAHVFAGSAVYANKVYVTSTGLGLRLTFMEGRKDAPEFFRTAVYLQLPDALSLKDVLTSVLDKMDFTIEPVEEAK